MFKDVKTIFFDFDGTLHNSILVYEPAFKKAYGYLVDKQLAPNRIWEREEIAIWLGCNRHEMWSDFMPSLDEKNTEIASQMIGQEMADQIKRGNGLLYPGTIKVLQYLKEKGYTLILLSNCGISYKTIVLDHYRLDKYFHEFICSEQYNHIPKFEILHKIKNNYRNNMVIVGDRIHDIEAGKKNCIFTIGCSYGYGSSKEFKDAHKVIHHISELFCLL